MKYVAYYRVSTGEQSRTGLGLEAQQADVRRYLDRKPDAELIDEFTENESGARSDRPLLLRE